MEHWGAPLQVPTIIVDPQQPVYVPGERLTLRCLAPGGEAVTSYQFYNQRGERVHTETTGLSVGPWLVLTAEMGKVGAYSCEYWAVRDGQTIYAARSQPVWISVMDFPLAPSISEISLPPGKSPVTIECSAPPGHVATRYQFLRQGNLIVSQPGARLQLRQSDLDATGPYTCSYEISVSGRMIQSLPSAPLSIHLTGPSVLPETFRPTLRLSPTGPEFTTGDSVTLMCSAPSWEKKMGFCFLKAGEQVACTKQDSQSYQIGRLGMEDSGSYTCMYWVAEPGQETSSLESQPISITVTGVPLPPPAPQIILDPPKRIYFQGEHVKLTCSVPGSEQVRGYRFYHQIGEQISELDEGAWLERTAMTGNAGAYSCAYWIIRSEQVILSGKSESVSITVTAPPLAPKLSLHPKLPVYLPGEKVTLNCSAPRGQEVAGFRFHLHRGNQTPEKLPAASGGAQMELTAQRGNDGSYTCQYWRWEARQEIASENSNRITVPVSDPPGKPSVSLSPDYSAYVAGDRVEINCSAPSGASPVKYRLYENGKPLGSLLGNTSSWQKDLQATGTRNATRSFACTYVELIQGRKVPSYASDPVSISVFPALAAPSLQLIPPLLLYVTGETVTAECVVPAGPYILRAHLVLRDGETLREQLGPQFPLNVTPSDSGTYQCRYSSELHRRHLRSPPSEPVPLSVTDPPPQPQLSVDPPSGVVSEGLPLLIICTAPGNSSERRFHFYNDGAEIPPGDTGSEISTMEPGTSFMNSVLSILRAGPSNTGQFSCGYEVNMSGRWIPSPQSQALNVTVTAWSLPVPLVAGCGGAATALALLLLLIPLCRKKTAASCRLPTSYWKSQELRRSRMRRSSDNSGVNMCGVVAETQPVYVNIPFRAGTALQQWSRDGQVQPVTHNQPAWSNKPVVGRNPQERGKREEDADARVERNSSASNTVYSTLTPPSSRAQQRGEKYISEDEVYSEIP
ncbi:immunoglobulin superfamily member 1-like [Trachemys scripta elegans]|uniref:immunoglobulin superfamily member 1-like n=1 Tax=Trachemys scripta elegans TaxID=31138 RepID=UPI0015568962|nr:immunoglobulin superfamily member 1-like [Trachemys scripta elegans]